MSVQTVNEIIGQYQVSKGVTKNDLEKLAINPKTQSIQFASPLTDKEIELLEIVIFSQRPDPRYRRFIIGGLLGKSKTRCRRFIIGGLLGKSKKNR